MDSPQPLFNALAGLAVVLGLVYCFAGFRIRRFILAVPGYIGGAAIFGAIAYLLSQQMWVAVLAGVFAGGPIGASIVLALYNVKVFSIGLLLGAVIDVALYLITDGQIEPAVLLIIPIVAGVLALMYDKWIIAAGTAFGGAGLAVGGIAYFAFGGVGPAALFALLEGDPSLLAATLGGWMVLGIAGVIVQYQSLKPRDGGDWWGGLGGDFDQGSSRPQTPALKDQDLSPDEYKLNALSAPPQIRRQALTGHRGTVHSIAWDPKGRWFATAGNYGDVFIWDSLSGAPLRRLWGSITVVSESTGLAVAPSGNWLAVGNYLGELWVWHPTTGRLIARRDAGAGKIFAFAVGPMEIRLALIEQGPQTHDGSWSLQIWNTTTWERVSKREGHFRALAMEPTGRWLASIQVGTVRFWDLANGRSLGKMTLKGLSVYEQLPEELIVTGDGRWLVSRFQPGGLRFWRIDDQTVENSGNGPEPYQGTPSVTEYSATTRVGLDCVAVSGKADRFGVLELWKLSHVPELLWQQRFHGDASAPYLYASPRGDWVASTHRGIFRV